MSGLYEFIEMSQHLPLIYLAVALIILRWVLKNPTEWAAFLSSLDTNGGHVVALVAILIIGYRMFQSDATAGGQLITGAEAALFILLNSKRPTRTGDPPDAPGQSTASVVVATSGPMPPAIAVAPVAPPVVEAPPA